jgi:hypothetical protein
MRKNSNDIMTCFHWLSINDARLLVHRSIVKATTKVDSAYVAEEPTMQFSLDESTSTAVNFPKWQVYDKMPRLYVPSPTAEELRERTPFKVAQPVILIVDKFPSEGTIKAELPAKLTFPTTWSVAFER